MPVTSQTLKNMLASSIFAVGTIGSSFGHAQEPAITGNTIAECDGGNLKASAGKLPTTFANSYWSHLGCGKFQEAEKILQAAPKAAIESGLPNFADRQSEAGQCYWDSFPYKNAQYFNVVADSMDPKKNKVHHGFYSFEQSKFDEVQRATKAACQAKLKP